MIIAFKNRAVSPDLANGLIQLWTGSPFIHCEMIFLQPRALAISARTKEDGVRMKGLADVLIYPNLWQSYRVESDDQAALAYLLEQDGTSFNYSGMVSAQVFKLPFPRPADWFCSELTYSVLRQFSGLQLPDMAPPTVHPGMLMQLIAAAGAAPVDTQELLIHQ